MTVIGLIFGYVYIRHRHVRKDGVVTIARVIDWQTSQQGVNLKIEIILDDHTYPMEMDRDFPAGCLGAHFFVRVDPSQPTEYPIFYTEPEVPASALEKARSPHFTGWNEFPIYPKKDRTE